MLTIRLFEEGLLKLFSRGLLRGTVHTCLGQEACAVGVVGALDPMVDVVCSNHRGHGHFLAFGGCKQGLLDEIMGRESGVCKGVGGSQHLHIKNFYSNGVLGGMVPVATGIAFAQKSSVHSGISVVFVGDGAMAEGVIFEALNLARLWCLPLLLVVENNHIAQSTPEVLEHGSPLEGIPEAFGVETIKETGNDVILVRNIANQIIDKIRTDSIPRCLILDTCRLGPHSKGDDSRSEEDIQNCRLRDPILKIEQELSKEFISEVRKSCADEINKLFAEV